MARLDAGDSGGDTSRVRALNELFRSYLDPNNPRLLGKVRFGAIVGDSARAAVGAVFVGVSTVWLALFNGFEIAVSAAEDALGTAIMGVGLSPQLLLRPAQAATAQAISTLGALGLPVATGTQLVSFGVIAFVIVLAWGAD